MPRRILFDAGFHSTDTSSGQEILAEVLQA